MAPVGKDALLIEAMLRRYAVDTLVCPNAELLMAELQRGAAAVLLAEEALAYCGEQLSGWIARQPTWSDLPVLLLTHHGADSPAAASALRTLGNVTLVERPVRVRALASAVHSALRARDRQYQTRAHVEEREEANQRKDQFLATLAHELRNPLAPIRNGLYVLERATDVGNPVIRSVSDMMSRQVDYLVRLVDDLMEVSRITRGKIDLRKSNTDLQSIISRALETSRPLVQSARHELVVSMPSEPLPLLADPVRLAQVFSNLLQNAAKYTDPGGRIRVAVERESAAAVVRVMDNGIGISPTALSRIFEMFVQADPHDSRAQTGLGIGLTLARSLVELHDGSITATSAGPGAGSTFVVRLPLTLDAGAREGRPRSEPLRIEGSSRILVVDDNRDAAESLSKLLGMLGAEVRVAHDGPSALELCAAFTPTLVFLDIGMPGMDGHEVAHRIRAQFDARSLMLVALTGRSQERDRRLSASAGFDHHLIKPADIDTIERIIEASAKRRYRSGKSAADRSGNGGPALSVQSSGGRG